MEEFKTQSDTVGFIAAALCAFQAEARGVKKTAENPYFHSKYAELSDVWDEIRGPLTKNGLSVVQTFLGSSLVTTLVHNSGEWFRGYLTLAPSKPNDPQAVGSAITYARRYALQAITGIAPIDDDGNAGSDRSHAPHASIPATKPAPANTEAMNKAQAVLGDLLTSHFQLSEPMKSKKGTFYWKAQDDEGANYFVWENSVVADLQVVGNGMVTVRVKPDPKFPAIIEVLKGEAA